MAPSESNEVSSMKELTSDISPLILHIPQHKPLFYPIGFEVAWVGLLPLFFILCEVLNPLGFARIN